MPPVANRAHVCKLLAVTALALLIPCTLTGVEKLPGPLPNCPLELVPQHVIAPVVSMEHAWYEPTVIDDALVIPLTVTGAVEMVVVPLPSWP